MEGASVPGDQVQQTIEQPQKLRGKKRRISELIPELRSRIPGLFDRGMEAERISQQFALPPMQILEEMIRETRRFLLLTRMPAKAVSRP